MVENDTKGSADSTNNESIGNKKDISTAQLLAEVEQARQSVIDMVNITFNRLIAYLGPHREIDCFADEYNTSLGEQIVPLSSNPVIFKGRRPIAVAFGNEIEHVKSWRDVLSIVLCRCNDDPHYHKKLRDLRGKLMGKVRVFLSDKPDNLTKPVIIDDDLYIEAHHSAEAMMRLLVVKILAVIRYDCSDIKIVMKVK